MGNGKKIAQPSDYPLGEFYLLQTFEERVVHHEGDERSRTAPGHGYPAHDERFVVVENVAFTDMAAWKQAIERLARYEPERPFAAFRVTRALVERQVRVEVNSQCGLTPEAA